MFEIKFKILEDENFHLLKNMNLAEFECEYGGGHVGGLLLLNFNGKKFGSLLLELNETLPPGVGLMDEEWLVMWFNFLNEVVKKIVLENQPYVALKYIENSSTWIEFLADKKGLLVISLLEVEPTGRGTFADKPFDKYTYGDWQNVEISIDEFADEVLDKTKQLILCVKEINPIFLQAKDIQKLIQYVENFEKLKSLHS